MPNSRLLKRAPRTASIARRLVCCAAVAVCVVAIPRPASAQTLWELTPYRVKMLVAVDPSPRFADDLPEQACAYLTARTDAIVGARFVADAVPAPDEIRRRMIDALDAIQWEDVEKLVNDEDKLYLIVIRRVGDATRVTVREVDVQTQFIGPPQQADVKRREELLPQLFRTVLSAFAPIARVDSAEGKEVKLRLRGAALPSRDASLRTVQPNDVFQPVIRYNHADGRARKINHLPWTYLLAEATDGVTVTCQMHSGLRGQPLSGRRRDRFEKLALLIHPPGGDTDVQLVSRDESHRPLAGYEVYAYPPNDRTPQLLGRTDRNGKLLVESTDAPLLTIVVKNGRQFLARFPVMPGLQDELEALVYDDDTRLAAEGFVTGMQERIVDMTTRREVLLSLARARLDAGDLEAAEAIANELRQMKDARQLAIEVRSEEQRLASNDPRTRAKIEQLFDDTRTLLNRHLNPGPVDALVREVTLATGGNPPAPATPPADDASAEAPEEPAPDAGAE